MPGFWDGGRSFKLRFSPDFEGRWDFRIISNLPSVDKKIDSFRRPRRARPASSKSSIRAYFQYPQANTPHYWMGDTCYPLATIPWEVFQQLVDARAEQKFNHMRGLVLGWMRNARKVLADPERPQSSISARSTGASPT